MQMDFQQITWTEEVEQDCRTLIRMAIAEDRSSGVDLTSTALVPDDVLGGAAVVARQSGILAGLRCVPLAAAEIDARLECELLASDGQPIEPGAAVARVHGPARSLLIAERILLNFVCRLSGIATRTRHFVERAQGTAARIYDTRKTTPGWRRMEKYAVRHGGGCNHRLGLSEAVLIKDNHLAVGAEGQARYSPAEAVQIARRYLEQTFGADAASRILVEVEVDTLQQLDQVLPARPDIVLLDNMPPELLRVAVEGRNAGFPGVELEASGTINLDTVAEVAATGVDRISAGSLTHGAVWLDFGLDWST